MSSKSKVKYSFKVNNWAQYLKPGAKPWVVIRTNIKTGSWYCMGQYATEAEALEAKRILEAGQ